MPVRGSSPGALPEAGLAAASALFREEFPVVAVEEDEMLDVEPVPVPDDDALGARLEPLPREPLCVLPPLLPNGSWY